MGKKDYIPALKFDSLSVGFDAFLKVSMRETFIKGQLIEYGQVRPDQTVLDFGCGTGTLIKMLLQRVPGVSVYGVDIDEKILAIAREKLSAFPSELLEYDGENLPYQTGFFDTVFSSLAVHHIASENRVAIFKELRRVLKVNGKLFVLDFVKPKDVYSFAVTSVLRNLEPIDDNIQGRLPRMLLKSGFVEVGQHGYYKTAFGALSILSGTNSQVLDARSR